MADVFEGKQLAIPYRPVAELLADYAARAPAKLAIVDLDQGTRIDYATLADLVGRAALRLKQLGVVHGDRVVLLSDEVLEKLVLWLAIWRLGAIAAPLNIEIHTQHIIDLTRDVLPRLVLIHRALDRATLTAGLDMPVVEFASWTEPQPGEFFATLPGSVTEAEIPERNAAEDASCIFCTSGTSGRPKLVVYDHAAYWLSGLDSIDMVELTAADRTLEYRSFGWNSAQILSLLPMLQVGLTMHIARRFSQSRFFAWIRDNGITFAAGVPAVINILLNAAGEHTAQDVPTLTRMTCSSAPLSPEQWDRFEQTYGLKLVQLYGMSEAGWICGNKLSRLRKGTVGPPAIHQDFQIIDITNGEPCPANVEGEVTTGGPQTALGYMHEGARIEPLRGQRLKCGDLATMDDDGFVRVTGRTKDLIIRGGVNIAPSEIDAVLLAIPGVANASALGVADPIYGEEVVAYVVAKPGSGLDAAAIIEHCRPHLSAAKLPKQVVMVAELPISDRGKVLRDRLRADWQERMQSPA